MKIISIVALMLLILVGFLFIALAICGVYENIPLFLLAMKAVGHALQIIALLAIGVVTMLFCCIAITEKL